MNCVYEGNFQDREQMKIEKAVRARYGRFFYRFPNGESAADVYDRITGVSSLSCKFFLCVCIFPLLCARYALVHLVEV